VISVLTPDDPRIVHAVSELQHLVQLRYPVAWFDVSPGQDPAGTYLRATVDVPDTDEVIKLVIDRLVELQVDEQLPIYFIPLRPRERVIAELKGHPLLDKRRRRVVRLSHTLR